MKRITLLMVFAVLVIVFILQAIPTQAYPVTGWTQIYDGIWYATGTATSPRLMKAFACKIDLQNPNVSIRESPGNGADPYDTTLQGTDAFLTQSGSKVAVNSCHWDVNTPSPYADVLGLLMCNGNQVSTPGGLWPNQIDFTSANVASFYRGGDVPVGTYNGNQIGDYVLIDGVPITWAPALNPYTGIGLSQDGRYLILLCVDGRQAGWSEGCYYSELGQWLLDFGAYNGAHMDGGGSTCMVREDIGVVNRPCYGYVRAVAASLGVYSTNLPEIIVDNPAGSWSSNWTLGSSMSGKYGADYRSRSTAAVNDPFTWTPTITTAGNYEVYAWWPIISKACATTPYIINYNGGSQTVNVDQRYNGGKWNSLGIFNFAAGTSGNIKLSCNTTLKKTVVADAVRLIQR